MKTVKFIAALVILIISPVLFTGCFGGGDPDYRVEFTLDGTDYIFTKAYDNPETVAEGCMDDDATKTTIMAENEDNPDQYVEITIPGINTGTFHDILGRSCFHFRRGNSDYFNDDNDTADDFTIQITEYGEVGGIIRGTFSGTVEDAAETEYQVTDGYFEVIRRADGAIVLK